MIENISRIANKIFLIAALVLFGMAILERIISTFGWTFYWLPYKPGRLLEYSAICVVFIIGNTARQIREELRKLNARAKG